MKRVTCCLSVELTTWLVFYSSFGCRFFHSLVRSCVLLIAWIVHFTEWSDVCFFALFLGKATVGCVKMCCEFELCVLL